MPNHTKPSKEELRAGMTKALDKLKALPGDGSTPPTPPSTTTPPALATPPSPTPPTPPTPPEDRQPPKTDEGTPPTPPSTTTPPDSTTDEEKKRDIDWQEKFKKSSTEVQILKLRDQEMDKAQEEADALPEPTDEEMEKVYANWSELDKVTQDLAKNNLHQKKKLEIVQTARNKFKEVQTWNKKVDDFLVNPETFIAHPELEGKVEEFKDFVSKPTRRGLELEDLVDYFKGNLAVNRPAPKTGQMFETGSGGPNTPSKPTDNKISLEQSKVIRKTDYKKYLELLKSGMIAQS